MSVSDIQDMMTGYRAFSFEFVKTFPVLSQGFEIETEMSIHAIDKNMYVEHVVIDYRDRPDGSESKLNTFTDGMKVLRMIVRLFRVYRPMAFFGMISGVLIVLASVFFTPVLHTYIQTGKVPNFPTLIVCGFSALAAVVSLFAGLILSAMVQKNRQDFEQERIRVNALEKEYKIYAENGRG